MRKKYMYKYKYKKNIIIIVRSHLLFLYFNRIKYIISIIYSSIHTLIYTQKYIFLFKKKRKFYIVENIIYYIHLICLYVCFIYIHTYIVYTLESLYTTRYRMSNVYKTNIIMLMLWEYVCVQLCVSLNVGANVHTCEYIKNQEHNNKKKSSKSMRNSEKQ